MVLSKDTVRSIQAFLCGDLTPDGFYAWVVSAEADDELGDTERGALAGLGLLLVECGEGLRSLDEVRAEAVALLTRSGQVPASR